MQKDFIYPENDVAINNIEMMDQLWVSLHERQYAIRQITEMPQTLTEKLASGIDINFQSVDFYNYILAGIITLITRMKWVPKDYDWDNYNVNNYNTFFVTGDPMILTTNMLKERIGTSFQLIRMAQNGPSDWRNHDDPAYNVSRVTQNRMQHGDIIAQWTYIDLINLFKELDTFYVGCNGAAQPGFAHSGWTESISRSRNFTRVTSQRDPNCAIALDNGCNSYLSNPVVLGAPFANGIYDAGFGSVLNLQVSYNSPNYAPETCQYNNISIMKFLFPDDMDFRVQMKMQVQTVRFAPTPRIRINSEMIQQDYGIHSGEMTITDIGTITNTEVCPFTYYDICADRPPVFGSTYIKYGNYPFRDDTTIAPQGGIPYGPMPLITPQFTYI